MLWKGFQRPKRLDFERETLTDRFGRFYAQPFERGFGTTIGNALRRVLLSSIEGAAITAVKIDGVLHEFSPIQGVVEDATDIILNLKQIPLTCHVDYTKTLYLRVDKPGEVRARDIEVDQDVEILEPDAHIATVAEGGKLHMELRIKRGRGYVVGRQELRRGSRHRLDSDRLGPLAGQEGQLPGRGGATRPDDRLRQADARRVDQRLGDAARRGVARRQAGARSPEHLHQPRRGGRAADRRRQRAGPARRRQRASRQERRGAGALGAVVQLPEERQHPDHPRARAEDRARDAEDEELRAQVAQRDQGNPLVDGAQPRHEARSATAA